MQDDVWLAVSSDVVIFFDSLVDHLRHFGRLRRVPLCAYLYFFALKGTTIIISIIIIIFLLNKFRQSDRGCYTAKNRVLFNRTAQERLKRKQKFTYMYINIYQFKVTEKM